MGLIFSAFDGKAIKKTVVKDKVYLFAPYYRWSASDLSANKQLSRSPDTLSLRNGFTGVWKKQSSDADIYQSIGFYLWARGSQTDKYHAPRVGTPPGNGVNTRWGIMPIVRLDLSKIVYAKEVKTSGNNYTASNKKRPASFILEDDVYKIDQKTVKRGKLTYGKTLFSGTSTSTYKLTVLSKTVKLSKLAVNGKRIQNKGSVTPDGDMLTLKGSGKNYSGLAYKIVDDTGGARTIIKYGTGKMSGLDIKVGALKAGKKYTVYVWAQKNHTKSSHEASVPIRFALMASAANVRTEAQRSELRGVE
jgi:hypothetical protein